MANVFEDAIRGMIRQEIVAFFGSFRDDLQRVVGNDAPAAPVKAKVAVKKPAAKKVKAEVEVKPAEKKPVAKKAKVKATAKVAIKKPAKVAVKKPAKAKKPVKRTCPVEGCMNPPTGPRFSWYCIEHRASHTKQGKKVTAPAKVVTEEKPA